MGRVQKKHIRSKNEERSVSDRGDSRSGMSRQR